MSGIDVQSRLRTGQLCLPDKEFRSCYCYVRSNLSIDGPIISVGLPTSPQGSDHLFLSLRGPAYGL